MIKKIAVTGGIGSGKSSVCALLKNMGYAVFSCDKISKEVLSTYEYVQAVGEHFPQAVSNGRVDVKKLSELIFSDTKKRETLNSVAHPRIMQRLHEQMDTVKDGLVFAEVPLLFEGNFASQFDEIVVVMRDKDLRARSIIERDSCTMDSAYSRIHAQFDYDSETAKSIIKQLGAYVIENNGDLALLKTAVQKYIVKQSM